MALIIIGAVITLIPGDPTKFKQGTSVMSGEFLNIK